MDHAKTKESAEDGEDNASLRKPAEKYESEDPAEHDDEVVVGGST